MNIIEIILKVLGGGNAIGKIASLLGIGQDQAGKAVNAAVPALLAGLIGSAAKPDGAARLSSLLSQQDPGLLDNLPNLLSQGSSAGTGASNPLNSILGGSGLGQMAGALSKFTGVGESGAGKLLGMLAPVVLGVVGKQAKGLDASGVANMLAGQKANVTAALPSGLGSLLSSAVPGLGHILGDTSKAASSVTDATASAVKATPSTAQEAARKTEAAGSSAMKWLVPIVLVVLALFLLPKFLRSKAPPAGSVTGAPVAESATFVGDVTDMIKNATETVASIKDEATATAALPRLQDINSKLTGLKSVWSGLPASAQTAASTTLRPPIAKLREALKPVLELPIVGDKIKPVVGELLASLDTFAPTRPQ